MYKISSLEAGTRFKFYGQTFTLGAMEWTITKESELSGAFIGTPTKELPTDVVNCIDEKGINYWIDRETLVMPIEAPKSNLADLSIKNKLGRLERTVESQGTLIASLLNHSNPLNLAGMVTDIVNLQNSVKKIEDDKQSFGCVAEIRRLQNAVVAIEKKYWPHYKYRKSRYQTF